MVLLAIEGVARLILPAAPPRAPDDIIVADKQVRDWSRFDPDLFYTLKPNATSDFQAWVVHTNRFGTRDPAPPDERAPNSLRVVCLGDSTAFGNFTTYPRELGNLLQEAFPDRKVEVMNAGIPGSTSFMGLTLFRRDLARLRPDIVTFCYGYNDAKVDADFRTDRERAAENARPMARVQRLLARSRLLARIGEAFRGSQPPRPEPINPFDPKWNGKPSRVPPDQHGENVELLKRACDEIGAKLVVIAQPLAVRPDLNIDVAPGVREIAKEMVARFDRMHAAEEAACAKSGAVRFDLASIFAKLDPELLFLDPWPGTDSIHANPIGLGVFAEELFAFLVEKQLVPAPKTMPDLPRFAARAPECAGVGVKRADGARDALVFATVVQGAPVAFRCDWTEPACQRIPIDLPAPTARASILPVPGDPDQFVVVGTSRTSELVWKSFRLSGGEGSVPGGRVEVPDDIAELRGLPADFDDDGAMDVLFVTTGPTGPPIIMAFGKKLDMLGPPVQVLASTMPHLQFCIGHFVLPSRMSVLAYSQQTKKIGGFVLGTRAPANIPSIIGQLGIAWAPTTIVPGHFTRSDGLDEAAVIRGSGVTVWVNGMMFEQVQLPLKSTRIDPELPPFGVIKIPGRPDGRVLFTSRAGDHVHVAELKDGAIREIASVQFP